MRVLYCTDTYLPQVNGVSVVTDVSARGLMARGWEVGVVAPRYPKPQLAARPNVVHAAGGGAPRVWEIRSFPAPRYPDLRMAVPDIVTMARVMRSFQPDLVHCA